MNAKRRKEIEKLSAQIEEIKMAIDSLHDDEQEAYDNLPDSLQEAERGQKMESAIEALDYASDDLQECLNHLLNSSRMTMKRYKFALMDAEYNDLGVSIPDHSSIDVTVNLAKLWMIYSGIKSAQLQVNSRETGDLIKFIEIEL